MKTLKIGIAGYDRMKARTMEIARGEYKPARGEPTVWFSSIESFAKVLSERNRELLAMVVQEKPDSLTELAEFAGRSTSNLSRTLKTMARYGLKAGRRGKTMARYGLVEGGAARQVDPAGSVRSGDARRFVDAAAAEGCVKRADRDWRRRGRVLRPRRTASYL